MLELVAARLIAPTLGVSLYTWTSVIGVVLGGVSLGNYLGGRLADRWPARSTLAFVYLAAAGASLVVLAVLPFVGSLELPRSAPALVQVLWVTAILFLLPSTVLGAPTPLLTRLTLDSVAETGRVVGRIQAAAALGSVLGAFATGFFFVSWFGTRHIVAGVAGVLLLLAVLAGLPRALARVWIVGLLAAVVVASGWASRSPCTRESAYYCIRVVPGKVSFTTPSGRRVVTEPAQQTLYLDHLVHALVDLADPTDLLYTYEQQYASVLARVVPHGGRLDAFFAGGGGFVFPRYVAHEYRGSVVVAEIDPAVTSVARELLGLRTSPRLRVVSEDARVALERLPPWTRFDAVFGDAFDDYEVPYHLATREFDALVAAHLRPGGLYLVNVIDGVHDDFLRSEVRTLRAVFPYVALVRPASGWPPSRDRSTYVLVAAKREPARALPVVSAVDLATFMRGGRSVLLTDDHAPVDTLLAPVFSQSLSRR
ncbi:MAG: fused MFS/spermidine synthase [Actinobacteria bacterium]|nr:fused MFS/spermidine synthase [Actinomycetota bacterium]